MDTKTLPTTTRPAYQEAQRRARAECFLSGCAIFEGIFQEFVTREGKIHPSLALFSSKLTHSTYALPLDGLSAAAIQDHVRNQDKAFKVRPSTTSP